MCRADHARIIRSGEADGPLPRTGEGHSAPRGDDAGAAVGHDGSMGVLRRVYAPVFALQTYLDSAYLVLGLAFGILWFTLIVTLYAVGLATAIVWVGIVVLVGTQALLRPIGAIERVQAKWLLRRVIAEPLPLRIVPVTDSPHPEWTTAGRWSHELVHDRHGWRILGWIVMRLVTGPVGFAVALAYVCATVALVAAPLLVFVDWGIPPGAYRWDRWFLLGPVAALLIAPTLAWAVKGLADLHRFVGSAWLGLCGDEIRDAALARASRAEEQIRIDQELHDSIGHMISMIVVQAGAGAHVFDRDPEFSRRALATIEERGRAALGELDRLIARIRGAESETTLPLPDARDIAHLIAGARDAGMPVRARIEVDAVPAAVGRGAFRVLQESLTNAAKHAPGRAVDVAVVDDGSVVAIAVANDVDPAASSRDAGGRGLPSIRDRVSLLGGHVTSGIDERGRFAVRAVIPHEVELPAGGDVDCTLTGTCRCLVCRLAGKVAA